MKTTHTTLTRAARIEAILAADNEITTEQARKYLTDQINSRYQGATFADKVKDFAMGEYTSQAFGINIIEGEGLCYGDIQYKGDYNSYLCSLPAILDIMERGDAEPNWWESSWTAVHPAGTGHWEGYISRGQFEDEQAARDAEEAARDARAHDLVFEYRGVGADIYYGSYGSKSKALADAQNFKTELLEQCEEEGNDSAWVHEGSFVARPEPTTACDSHDSHDSYFD